jgi:hypothetical protein
MLLAFLNFIHHLYRLLVIFQETQCLPSHIQIFVPWTSFISGFKVPFSCFVLSAKRLFFLFLPNLHWMSTLDSGSVPLQTVCTYWLRGMCMKGDQCGFLHQYDVEKMPICRNLLKFGECKELDCPYKHNTGTTSLRQFGCRIIIWGIRFRKLFNLAKH